MATTLRKLRKKSRASSKAKKKPADTAPTKTHDVWRGVISFGLVEIPVALVSTKKSAGLSLSMLDKRDLSPIGYKRYNKSTEAEVPWADIVHGYEYEKGNFVVVGKKDIAKADPELAGMIVIDQFVDASEVSPIQFDRPYYMEPLNARSKGYSLLRAALENTGKVGVARMVLRTRQYVALVAVHGPALLLHLLRFDAEIRPPSALENLGGSVRVTEAESKMAEKLIEDMSGPWEPANYIDEYTSALIGVIERKVKSGDVHAVEKDESEPKRSREVVDLMPLLKRSLERPRSPGRAAPVRPRAAARTRPPTRRASRVRRA